ncbi:uncharacterized protein LOC127281459 [Leptopilina boulardi]|uniref:uncharacterized protein LOC127281459 n=1 Tax=Leptopilina boulardi TaxID=63433 RepID=UPI0021F56302|nr:uncharacterized protein LOC127281459 [Leptopilina boulardi]
MNLSKRILESCGILTQLPQDNLSPEILDKCENVEQNNITESNSSSQCLNEWSQVNTAFLLDKYAEYLPEVGPMKKFKTKVHLFKQVAHELNEKFSSEFTGIQCCSRMKTILKRKNFANKSNKTSGNTRTKIEYQEELAKVAAIDDSYDPEIKIGVGRMEVTEKPCLNILKSRKRKQVEDQLQWKIHEAKMAKFQEIIEMKEAAKQKRHEEKMALLKQLFEGRSNHQQASEN